MHLVEHAGFISVNCNQESSLIAFCLQMLRFCHHPPKVDCYRKKGTFLLPN